MLQVLEAVQVGKSLTTQITFQYLIRHLISICSETDFLL